MAEIETLLPMVIILMVRLCFAARCSSVEELNQCYIFKDLCYSERKNILRCEGRMEYHCCWDPVAGRFREACAESVECNTGTEPWLIQGGNGFTIVCNYCHDPLQYYNPFGNRMSNEYSQCDVRKDECSSLDNKVKCPVLTDTEIYTKNVRCRCDVRKGYRTDRPYNEKITACAYDHGLSCVKASCYPTHDILLHGYLCAPKCPPGYNRTDEETDDCLPVSTNDQPQETPEPLSTTGIRPLPTVLIHVSTISTTDSSPSRSNHAVLAVIGILIFLVLLSMILMSISGYKGNMQCVRAQRRKSAIGSIRLFLTKRTRQFLTGKRKGNKPPELADEQINCLQEVQAEGQRYPNGLPPGYQLLAKVVTNRGKGPASTNKQKSTIVVRAEVQEPLIEKEVSPTELDSGYGSTGAVVPIKSAPYKQCYSNSWKEDYYLHRSDKRTLQVI